MSREGPRFVLFGTGGWGDWAHDLFATLATGGGHAAVVAAGQAGDGAEAVGAYQAKAREKFALINVPSVDVPLLAPGDGDRPEAVAALDGAAFVYVLGGGPKSSVDALRDSVFIEEVLARPVPYVGYSGGAMLLGARYPPMLDETAPALAVFPGCVIAPHWNELDEMRPGFRDAFIADASDDTLIGIDRDAGLAGDGTIWRVVGLNQVHVLHARRWATYHSGDGFSLPLLG